MAKKKTPRIGRPPTGQMPKLNVRVSAEDLRQLNAAAAAAGESTSAFLRRIIRERVR